MTDAERAGTTRRLITGLLLLVIAGAGWRIMAADQGAFTSFVMRGDPGPFLLPAICLTALAAAGTVLLLLGLAGLAQARRHGLVLFTSGAARAHAVALALPFAFLVSVAAMPPLMAMLGSFWAIVLFASLWIAALGVGSGTSAARLCATALALGFGTAAAVQTIFVRLLNVPLP